MSTPNTTNSAPTTALGKRKAASKAGDVIKAATRSDDDNDLHGVSDDEKEEPAKKRTKASSATKAPANSNKPTATYVGTVKKGIDHLPVRAEQYSNGCINYRVNRDDVPADVAERQRTFLSTKRQVKPEDVIFDVDLFPAALGVADIQTLSAADKKVRVRTYLTTIAGNQPAPIVQPVREIETAGAAHQPDDAQIPVIETASATRPAAAPKQPAPIVEATSATRSGPSSEQPAPVVETAPTTRTLRRRKQPAPIVERASASRPVAPPAEPATPIVHPLSASLKPTTNITLSSDILIGTLKAQTLVEVYAYLRPYGLPHFREKKRIVERGKPLTTACFRIHPGEVDGELQAREGFPTKTQTVFLSQTNVLDKFKKEDEAATREYIRSVLESRYEAQQEQRAGKSIFPLHLGLPLTSLGADFQEYDDIAEAHAHFKRPEKPKLSKAAAAKKKEAAPVAKPTRRSTRATKKNPKKKTEEEFEVEEISDWDEDEVIPAGPRVVHESGAITIEKILSDTE